jgi:hypothetical protein
MLITKREKMNKLLLLILTFLIFTACSLKPSPTIDIQDKYALVIGNSRYQEGRLANALKDAIAMKNFLRRKGFEVTFVSNGTSREMRSKINLFINKLSSKSVAFVYYSGHGTQEKYKNKTKNYLIPIDNKRIITLKKLDKYAISLHEILDPMLNKNQGLNIVLLDACRTSMYRSFSRSNKRGFAPTRANGVFLAYATESGQTASDSGRFRKSFIKYANQDLELEEVLEHVKEDIQESIGQTPFIYNDKNGNFKFSEGKPIPIKDTSKIQIYNSKNKYAEKYAFYGHFSSKGNRWKSKYFQITNRSSYEDRPQVGDVLEAKGNINIRKGYILKSKLKWRNLPPIGLIHRGNRIVVKEVTEVVKSYYWIRF